MEKIMNRVIKFRVWDSLKKGYLNYPCYFNHLDFNEFTCFDRYFKCDEERITVQQFTGLKDKNGKEIYEGDILRISRDIVYKARIVDTESHVCEVYYGTDGFWLKGRFHHRHITDWDTEAIGNIFENPELLK